MLMSWPGFVRTTRVPVSSSKSIHSKKLLLVDEDTFAEGANVQRAKLWSDNVKWALARMNRAKYGDKQDINLGGQDDAPPIETQTADLTALSPEERAKVRDLARKALQKKE